MEVTDLPAVNATLNGLSALLLVAGFVAVKSRRIALHRALMLTAVATSALFLSSYLYYHARAGHREYAGEGAARFIYHYVVLLPHVTLAVVMVPMIATMLLHAFRGRIDRHRRLARWTLPIWLYVSVSGVVVYIMLYW
ncbi:MAG: DUF420 domain-containing protein [Planctomycetes bacterium]|nr:DUF420 domain-containing protein [Planctomycetota bacterium]